MPARAPPPPAAPRAPAPPAPAVSPSTTAESVAAPANNAGSREPLLASLDDDAQKVRAFAGPAAAWRAPALDPCALQEACGQCGCEARGAGAGAGAAGARCGRCAALARLAGVTPLHGHAHHHSAGWL